MASNQFTGVLMMYRQHNITDLKATSPPSGVYNMYLPARNDYIQLRARLCMCPNVQ